MIFKLEPVKRDKRGKKIADYSVRDFYEKLSEELLEAHEIACTCEDINESATNEITELLDLMTVCTTRINVLLPLADCYGGLEYLQKKIIERNRRRGYFDEN